MYLCSYESGLVLATLCNFLITIPLGISLVLVLETMARGTMVLEYEKSRKRNFGRDDEDAEDDGDDSSCLIPNHSATSPNQKIHSPTKRNTFADSTHSNVHDIHKKSATDDSRANTELLLVGDKKIELADLAEMFLGQKGKYSFLVFVR